MGQFDRTGSLTQKIVCRMSEPNAKGTVMTNLKIYKFGIVHFKGFEIPKIISAMEKECPLL